MGNVLNSLKKVIANKNNLSILILVIGIFALYMVYDKLIDNRVKYVTVLYAKEDIPSNTQITSEMIGNMNVTANVLKTSNGVVQNINSITDSNGELYYVNFDSTIPAGSILYKDVLIAPSEKKASKLVAPEKGTRYLYFDVNMATTLGNAIAPGNSIDLYAYISGQEKMFGKLYENIEVVDVVDSSWSTTAGKKGKSPSLLVVKVSEEDYNFLNKAKKISGIELIPAPNNKPFKEIKTGTTCIEGTIKYYIESQFMALSNS